MRFFASRAQLKTGWAAPGLISPEWQWAGPGPTEDRLNWVKQKNGPYKPLISISTSSIHALHVIVSSMYRVGQKTKLFLQSL